MSELIDRAMAIESVERMMDIYYDRKVILAKVIERLKDLPSAEPKWIPMTEKLPEDGEHILISCTNGYVATITYSEVGERRHMTAWMPLPEPYKED